MENADMYILYIVAFEPQLLHAVGRISILGAP
jgi:hypothetical protein